MNKTYPDKYIRKALFDLLDGIVVNTKTINVYDTRVTGGNSVDPDNYILLSSQTAETEKGNKCEYRWLSSIVLDVITKFRKRGNPGSRLLVDDIVEEVRSQINTSGITLGGGLTVMHYDFSVPNGFTDPIDNEIIQRKIIRLELRIN